MLIIQSLKYIEEFYSTATLLEVSEKLNQPDYKLSKLIKKHTKMTFKELLQEKAKQSSWINQINWVFDYWNNWVCRIWESNILLQDIQEKIWNDA